MKKIESKEVKPGNTILINGCVCICLKLEYVRATQIGFLVSGFFTDMQGDNTCYFSCLTDDGIDIYLLESQEEIILSELGMVSCKY